MSTPNTPAKSINAWIYLNEDEPAGTSYNSANSCYQTLIDYGVYRSVDMLNIGFFETVPQGNGTYTIQIGDGSHPGGATNADYLGWVVRDARQTNPNIKILATQGYGADEFSPIFAGPSSGWQASANAFGHNVLAFLQANDLDGIDIDWEQPVDTSLTQAQFAMLFQAIRAAFATAKDRYYYLTLSPADFKWNMGYIDAPTVNTCFDFANLQMYCGFITPQQYAQIGIAPALLQYGAKFESKGNGVTAPYQTAQNAWQQMQQGYSYQGTTYTYTIATQWRLNSGDYQFEQAQQMLLHQLAYPTPAGAFDDGPTAGAAGNPPITQLTVRSGNVLDAIQATNTGSFDNNVLTYPMPQHGGNGGNASVISLAAGDVITTVSGYTGLWYGWNVVQQITVTTRNGNTYGPFGTKAGATSSTPFTLSAPAGQSVVAFSGSTVLVPEAGGGQSYVVATLGIVCA